MDGSDSGGGADFVEAFGGVVQDFEGGFGDVVGVAIEVFVACPDDFAAFGGGQLLIYLAEEDACGFDASAAAEVVELSEGAFEADLYAGFFETFASGGGA